MQTTDNNNAALITAVTQLIAGIVFLAILFWVIRAALISAARHERQAFSPIFEGPGQYLVEGVDRSSGAEKSIRIKAKSRANAKAKGELAGLIVTDATFVGSTQ